MYFTYFDTDTLTETARERALRRLRDYRDRIMDPEREVPEYALVHPSEPELHETLATLEKRFAKAKHVLLIGIGGSSLGTEAVHAALGVERAELSVLDTISGALLERTLAELTTRYKDPRHIAVCVISKSGSTTETMSNVAVVSARLEARFGKAIREQFIYIGDPGTDFLKAGKRRGGSVVAMPPAIGGRYSVATAVGLVPLALLGHDVDEYINGFLDANGSEFEVVAADGAARLFGYVRSGVRHYNFFAFEPRLWALGAWYRQLAAESLGKEFDRSGKQVKYGFLPTVSTPVELHSIGQLYLSGFSGVYTDFVTFDDEEHDPKIPNTPFSKRLAGKTAGEVATAIYGGVIGAYQERQLPYRATVFDEGSRAYALGCFMALRMRETMYLAELLDLNAFDQPNVELYKQKSRDMLGLS